jgi:hypothetical protein
MVDLDKVLTESISDSSMAIKWLRKFFRGVIWCTFAWELTTDEQYGQMARHLIHVWLIRSLNPNSVISLLDMKK